jgi:Ca2+-binding EF-hand superfamily protein
MLRINIFKILHKRPTTSGAMLKTLVDDTFEKGGVMSISGINNNTQTYGFQADKSPQGPESAVESTATSIPERPSTIVTLSEGTTSSVQPGTMKSSMPLSEAWGPQLFVLADTNGDKSLNDSEFAELMNRIGMPSDQAEELFSLFDTTKENRLSIDEFVEGIKSSNSQGNSIFQNVIDTIICNPTGEVNESALQNFLKQGSSAAESYWSRHNPR